MDYVINYWKLKHIKQFLGYILSYGNEMGAMTDMLFYNLYVSNYSLLSVALRVDRLGKCVDKEARKYSKLKY